MLPYFSPHAALRERITGPAVEKSCAQLHEARQMVPLPMNLPSQMDWRRFSLSPSQGERAGVRGLFLWNVQGFNARIFRGILPPKERIGVGSALSENDRNKSWLNCGVFEVVCWLELGRSFPPHPFPLPKGEGATLDALEKCRCSGSGYVRRTVHPLHEPQGRARLSPARRAADAKWKRRARDRRALPLLGSGAQCADFSGNSLPGGEGRGEGRRMKSRGAPRFWILTS